jgi:hypothetical protein
MKAIVNATLLSIVLWAIVVSTVLAVFGCSAPPRSPFEGRQATIEEALAPPLGKTLLALALEPEPVQGFYREIYGRTSCRGSIPLPYLIPATRPPRVGQEWQCLFVTTVSSTPPEPDWLVWIVMSTRPPAPDLPFELSPIGLPGCQLLVNPELLISTPAASAPGELLTRAEGRGQILFRWTPPPGMGGSRLWMQLLVAAPGKSPGGFLMSHAIELIVGT